MASFRDMHRPGSPFILANAWDVGSARMLAAMGAQALATSSAAHAFTLGRPDGLGVSRDEALAHAQQIVEATSLPVQGDFENGWAEAPEAVAETLHLAAEVGLAGICIEDIDLPSSEAYPFDLAVERIKATAAAAQSLPRDFVLTARADGIMTGAYDLNEAIKRLQAFEAAGADCLYAPLPQTRADLERICASVSKPVNVLAAGPVFTGISLAEYGKMGAARVSLGAALARVTHGAIAQAAEGLFARGEFAALGAGISGDQVDEMLRRFS